MRRLALLSFMPVWSLAAQSTTVRGHVTDRLGLHPLPAVRVSISGMLSASTNDAGAFAIAEVPLGAQHVSARRIGYRPIDTTIVITASTPSIELTMVANPTSLGEVSVTAVSRQPERIVDAPAAISVVDPTFAKDMHATGQTPLLVANLPGVHAVQSGVYDFNLGVRGFNSALSRSVLVLVDGRDVSVPLLGNQDWAGIAILGDDVSVEMVRGPGSALYGANALSGVLAINSPALRVAHNSRVSVTGGELSTLRMDASSSALSSDARFAYRASGGYARSSTWDVSRTNVGDMQREYSDAGIDPGTVHPPAPGFEVMALNGQTKSGTPGAALGTADAVTTAYGSLRGDYYPSGGSVVTLEGGTSRIENPVNTTGIGRSQVLRADRPWARAAWTGDAFSLMSYYSGRKGNQVSLGSGVPGDDQDAMIHTEGQFNRHFLGDRGRIVLGASIRRIAVDTKGTLLAPSADARDDWFYATFGQAEYAVSNTIRLVAAGRVDKSSLDAAQTSPKFAVVYKPRDDQSIRATYSSGFRAPSTFERFLGFPAGPPLNLTPLEQGLRASPLGPALAGVPVGTLFTNSNAVPLRAVGNHNLKPQEEKSWELGYKAEEQRVYFTTDVYFSRLDRFISGLLSGVNSDYPAWTAPAAVPASARAAVEGAVMQTVGGLTRLPDGSTEYVVSFGNEGRATEWGGEVATGAALTQAISVDANYALHRWKLDRATLFAADTVASNTPRHTVNAGVQYRALNGAHVRVQYQYNDAFAFHDYQWTGEVPVSHFVDVTGGMPVGRDLALSVAATNVLDERRYRLFGGSVIGRRALVTLTWAPSR